MTKTINGNLPGGHGSKRNFCKRVNVRPARFRALSLSVLFVSAMAFSIFTGCSSSDGGDTTVTKTADVSVAANNFSVGTTLDFAPVFSFTGADAAYFNAADITYTLTSTNPEVGLSDCTDDGLVPASKYSDTNTPTITQVFYYNSQEIGRRSIASAVSGSYFSSIYDDNTNWNILIAIPAVTLQQISKEVTE